MATEKKSKREVTETVVIFDQCGEQSIEFYVLKGDYRHLNGVYINVTEDDSLTEELNQLIYEAKPKKFTKFPRKAVIRGAAVIVAGFPP